MVRLALAVILAVFSLTTVSAVQIWELKPYASWTASEARNLLKSSPWSGKASLGSVTVPVPQPRGWNQIPNRRTRPPYVRVHVLWSSARVMREATARAELPQWAPAGAPLSVTGEPADYVVRMVIRDAPFAHWHPTTLASLPPARLVAGSKSVSSSAVAAVVRDPDGQIVERLPSTDTCNRQPQSSPWIDYRSWQLPGNAPDVGRPDEFRRCDLAAVFTFTFPKTEPFVIDDREVEFEFVFEGQYSVRRKFHLREMTLGGVLAL